MHPFGREPQGCMYFSVFFFLIFYCPVCYCVSDGLSGLSATRLSLPLYPRCSSPPEMKAQVTKSDVIVCYR